jgi:hypothetical protein
MTLEAGFIQLDRMAVEKDMVAFAAAWSCAGALGGHTIRGLAVRADDMQSVIHRAFLIESIMIIGYGAARQKKKGQRNIVPQPKCDPAIRTVRAMRFSVADPMEALRSIAGGAPAGSRMPAQAPGFRARTTSVRIQAAARQGCRPARVVLLYNQRLTFEQYAI